jgi:hypothetical protein
VLGQPRNPDSRHLLAYGEGDPVNRSDPDGRTPLGDCGIYSSSGCTASANGWPRYHQWRRFFLRFPGYFTNSWYNRLTGKWTTSYVPYSGTGMWGSAMLEFMAWIVSSGRVDGSDWWNEVNREIVQGSLTAWRKSDLNLKYVRVTSSASSYRWYVYIRDRMFDPGGDLPLNYYGRSSDEAWAAHQRGLWNGVLDASLLLGKERPAEQLVIYKVLANVEVYYRLGHPLDGLPGFAKTLGGYPDNYPASTSQACNMWGPNQWPVMSGPFWNFVSLETALERRLC